MENASCPNVVEELRDMDWRVSFGLFLLSRFARFYHMVLL